MPRRGDPIRKYVQSIPDVTKQVKCTICQQVIGNSTRTIRSHFRRCPRLPISAAHENIQSILNQYEKEQAAKKEPLVRQSILGTRNISEFFQGENSDSEPPEKKKKPSRFTDYKSAHYHVLSTQQQQRATLLLLNFIIKSAKSLCIVEDESFKSFINFINPSFKIPNRDQITNIHLPVFYKLVKSEVEKIIAELGSVTIGLDGSADGNGNAIEHVMAMRGKHSLLLAEIQMYDIKKDAEKLKHQ